MEASAARHKPPAYRRSTLLGKSRRVEWRLRVRVASPRPHPAPVLVQQVQALPTRTSITGPSGTVHCGQTAAFTVSVAGGTQAPGVTPTGSVDFYDQTAQTDLLPSPVVLVGGTATPSLTIPYVAGSPAHTILATYQPDPAFAASSASISEQTVLQTSTTLVSSSSARSGTGAPYTYTSNYGQSFTYTVTISSPDDPSWTPSGGVQLLDESNGYASLGDGTVSSPGVVTFTSGTSAPSALSLGSHTILAYYGGMYAGGPPGVASSYDTISENVLPMPVTTTVSAFANGSVIGYHSDAGPYPSYPFWEPIGFWGTVLTGSVSPTTGYVTLYNNGTAIATGTLVGTSGRTPPHPRFWRPSKAAATRSRPRTATARTAETSCRTQGVISARRTRFRPGSVWPARRIRSTASQGRSPPCSRRRNLLRPTCQAGRRPGPLTSTTTASTRARSLLTKRRDRPRCPLPGWRSASTRSAPAIPAIIGTMTAARCGTA